jgi:hypothetical protein
MFALSLDILVTSNSIFMISSVFIITLVQSGNRHHRSDVRDRLESQHSILADAAGTDGTSARIARILSVSWII